MKRTTRWKRFLPRVFWKVAPENLVYLGLWLLLMIYLAMVSVWPELSIVVR